MLDDKEYVAQVRLGISTDTDDTTGRILTSREPPVLSEDEAEALAAVFRGTIKQVPPAVSALKHGGRRWYRLAREGTEFERTARDVVIHDIEVQSVSHPFMTLRIVCSKGTYIRALARDIGELAECGGCLADLVRTRAGRYKLEDAIQVEEEVLREGLAQHIIPLEDLLEDWPKAVMDDRVDARLRQGAAISSLDLESTSRQLVHGDNVRLFASSGRLISIARVFGEDRGEVDRSERMDAAVELRPLRLLVDPEEVA
jgi:tRNA pseudouridine55 synthase